MPKWGETILGESFKMGPGGKGSNQAVAAARLDAEVRLITKLGRDAFGAMARKFYEEQGMSLDHRDNLGRPRHQREHDCGRSRRLRQIDRC
jgi:ribokinase